VSEGSELRRLLVRQNRVREVVPELVRAAVDQPSDTQLAAAATDADVPERAAQQRALDLAPTCRISCSCGRRKAVFYAWTHDDGEEVALAESRPFRARLNGVPVATAEAREAYRTLCDELERLGWVAVSSDHTWFGTTFRLDVRAAEAARRNGAHPDRLARLPSPTNVRAHLAAPLYRNAYLLIMGAVFASAAGFLFWALAARR
jgi:hypothetical protein